jgi:hypothetical protein
VRRRNIIDQIIFTHPHPPQHHIRPTNTYIILVQAHETQQRNNERNERTIPIVATWWYRPKFQRVLKSKNGQRCDRGTCDTGQCLDAMCGPTDTGEEFCGGGVVLVVEMMKKEDDDLETNHVVVVVVRPVVWTP